MGTDTGLKTLCGKIHGLRIHSKDLGTNVRGHGIHSKDLGTNVRGHGIHSKDLCTNVHGHGQYFGQTRGRFGHKHTWTRKETSQ